ncbi:MAG: zeta toxin family protein [Acetobacter aceti]
MPAGQFSAGTFAEPYNRGEITVSDVLKGFAPDTQRRIDTALAAQAVQPSTKSRFFRDGAYSPERARVHEQIKNQMIEEAIEHDQGAAPTLVVLGGRGGSGKSSLKGVVYDESYVRVDPDQVKAMLPGYSPEKASEYHEESSDIAYGILDAALEAGLNVVLDVTLRSSAKALQAVESAREHGHRVEAHYMFLPREEAAKRGVARFLSSGRLVPPQIILDNTTNEHTFDLIKGRADAWSFRSNMVPWGSSPVIISEKHDETVQSGRTGKVRLSGHSGHEQAASGQDIAGTDRSLQGSGGRPPGQDPVRIKKSYPDCLIFLSGLPA